MGPQERVGDRPCPLQVAGRLRLERPHERGEAHDLGAMASEVDSRSSRLCRVTERLSLSSASRSRTRVSPASPLRSFGEERHRRGSSGGPRRRDRSAPRRRRPPAAHASISRARLGARLRANRCTRRRSGGSSSPPPPRLGSPGRWARSREPGDRASLPARGVAGAFAAQLGSHRLDVRSVASARAISPARLTRRELARAGGRSRLRRAER